MSLFADLLAHEGVVEDLTLASTFGFLAFHGGSLEEETDRIACAAAAAAGASCYTVALPPDLQWHVPSKLVTPDASDRLAAFLDHVDVCVAVHGFGRDGLWDAVLLGGRNRALADHVASRLRRHLLDGYAVLDDLDAIPVELRGVHPDNPVNRPSGGGVQLELPPRVRGLSPRSRDGEVDALVAGLAEAALRWPPRRPARPAP